MLFPPLIAYVDVTDNNIESKKPIGAPKQKTGHREMNDDSQPSSSNGLKESGKKPGDASFSEEEKKLIKQGTSTNHTLPATIEQRKLSSKTLEILFTNWCAFLKTKTLKYLSFQMYFQLFQTLIEVQLQKRSTISREIISRHRSTTVKMMN